MRIQSAPLATLLNANSSGGDRGTTVPALDKSRQAGSGRSRSEPEENHAMRSVMNKQIHAAVIIAAIVGAPIAAFAQTAYLPSYNGSAGEVPEAAPANVPYISPFDGPRPSS